MKFLAHIYSLFMRLRAFFYKRGLFSSHLLHPRTISIGNLSMGGSGKTPVTLFIAKFLEEMEKKGCVLSRGYKSDKESLGGVLSRFQAKNLNSLEKKSFGDEPLMLFEELSLSDVIVGKNRVKSFQKYSQSDYDFIILDDGFQHLKIKRSLNIVLIDLSMELKLFHPLPLGYLRESEDALLRADVLMFSKRSFSSASLVNSYEEKFKHFQGVTCEVDFKLSQIKNREGQTLDQYSDTKKVSLISAIAHNQKFYKTIRESGLEIVEHFAYPDHYQFTQAHLDKAFLASDVVICTQKDFAKLKGLKSSKGLFYAKIDLEFISGEELLKSKLRELF